MATLLLTAIPMCALAVWVVAKGTHEAMERMGLDLMTVLVYLGLAEWTSPAEPTRDRVIARFDERARRSDLASTDDRARRRSSRVAA